MPRSFRTPEDFRAWLERHHATKTELIVRLFKVRASHRGIGYKEALDEALCFGWIDGVRRGLDGDSYTQRFTPRKKKSNWSRVNIARAGELRAAGRMHAAGLAAFEQRDEGAVAPYSFESPPLALARAFAKQLRANKAAWIFFSQQAPSYRRVATYWVMSAKRPETRARRLATLIDCSAKGRRIPPLS